MQQFVDPLPGPVLVALGYHADEDVAGADHLRFLECLPVLLVMLGDLLVRDDQAFGEVLFQHRNHDKFCLSGNNVIPEFEYEDECFRYVRELGMMWDVHISEAPDNVLLDRMSCLDGMFKYTRKDFDSRNIELLPNGDIGQGRENLENRWLMTKREFGDELWIISSDCKVTARYREIDGRWEGFWVRHEKMYSSLEKV